LITHLVIVFALTLLCAASPSAAYDTSGLRLIRPTQTRLAANFTVPTLSGGSIRLRDLRDQVVLVEFWATWSISCREQLPALERLYQRYRHRSFAIVGIALDADGAMAVGPMAKQLGLTFPIGLDPKHEVARQYSAHVLPTTVLIDQQQRVVGVAIGHRDWTGRDARETIEALLRPAPVHEPSQRPVSGW
jgi:peroxiredoxin